MGNGNKTFIRITNKDIFEKLLHIEAKVEKQNNKISVIKWVSTTALTLVIFLIGALINNMVRGG